MDTLGEVLTGLIIAFLAGAWIKWRIVASYRKRVLQLEDEMLDNHSRILDLEKKNAQLEQEIKIYFINKGHPELPKEFRLLKRQYQ